MALLPGVGGVRLLGCHSRVPCGSRPRPPLFFRGDFGDGGNGVGAAAHGPATGRPLLDGLGAMLPSTALPFAKIFGWQNVSSRVPRRSSRAPLPPIENAADLVGRQGEVVWQGVWSGANHWKIKASRLVFMGFKIPWGGFWGLGEVGRGRVEGQRFPGLRNNFRLNYHS